VDAILERLRPLLQKSSEAVAFPVRRN